MEGWFAGEKRTEVSLWRGLMRLCFPLPCRSCLTSGKRARPCPQSGPESGSKVPESTAEGLGCTVLSQCEGCLCTVKEVPTLRYGRTPIRQHLYQLAPKYSATANAVVWLPKYPFVYSPLPWAEASKTTQNCRVQRHTRPLWLCFV